jgi:quercetin dioxygenase-like cupin family protein
MRHAAVFVLAAAILAGLAVPRVAPAAEGGKPPAEVLKVTTPDLPKEPTGELRVYHATLGPGEATPWHTHPAPVVVYVVRGTLVLEVQGKPPAEARAGQAILEPTNVALRARNGDKRRPVEAVIFQAAGPGQPFFQPAQK